MVKDPGISLSVYGRTDVGLIREHNEDNFLIADLSSDLRTNEITRPIEVVLGDRGLVLLVCDGMGGAAAGEVASQMAVETISNSMAAQIPVNRDHFARTLRGSIEDANDKIYAQSRDNQNERGMGTTCTAAAIVDGVLVAGQIGDSRCYVMRNGKLGMVTKDQSLAWQLIEAGAMTHEEAKGFEHANIILQALGVQERVDVVLSQLPLCRGDVLLLSSDGLHGPVSDEIIAATLINEPDLKKAGDTLIARALENEGPDNVTVVLARVDGDHLPAPDSAPVVFQAYDPGQDPADASRPRVALNEKETVEVRLVAPDANALVPTSEDGLNTIRQGNALVPRAARSGGVVTFVILTLVAALAAGLYLRFDRSRGLEKERESLEKTQASTPEDQAREAP
ncbi:MAG: protein phosphatase 2C domain-containing protein [Deltaproteobacteria bacterium]|nr:protein phosphatase 2C domain-containing protein [Deltaproteobacteria bacterium]